MKLIASRNTREGGYCGKDGSGNHYHAGLMTPNKWNTPYPTLRQWHKQWAMWTKTQGEVDAQPPRDPGGTTRRTA